MKIRNGFVKVATPLQKNTLLKTPKPKRYNGACKNDINNN